MRIVFKSKQSMEREVGWIKEVGEITDEGTWKNVTMFEEVLEVDPKNLEVLSAVGYDTLIGTLLVEHKLKILR